MRINVVGRRFISYSRHLQQYAKTGYGKGPVARVKATLDEETVDYLQQNKLKPGQHQGAYHLSKVTLPEKFRHAVELIASHENVRVIAEDAVNLRNYLWSRQLPIEDAQFQDKVEKIEDRLRRQEEVLLPFLSQKEIDNLEKKRQLETLKQLRKSIYPWNPVRYSRHKGLAYIFGRSSGEYAALCRIFNEVSKRDPEFKPATLCDFGSGIGTVSWAAREYWSSSLVEHLCADMSSEMNDLAELILRGGAKNDDHPIPALFFRNHLPESYKIRYDLVVSAFSLLELPSAKARLEAVDKLWKKTEQYLVIVEQGNKAGFNIIIEARDYILGLGSKSRTPTNCYVFSPCPHSQECPRFVNDTTPCNFSVKYRPVYPFHIDGCQTDSFSYVVIRRGYPDPNDEQWPRLIEEPMIKTRHVICRLCTKDCKLSEVVLTKAKHSQPFRLIAKRSKLGDQLPIHIKDYMFKNIPDDALDNDENK